MSFDFCLPKRWLTDRCHLPMGLCVQRPAAPLVPIPSDPPNNPLLHVDKLAVAQFRNTTGRPLTCYDLGQTFGPRSLASAFVVDVDVWDPQARKIEGWGAEIVVMQSFVSRVPPADILLANNAQTFTLQPGEETELPMSLFSMVTHPRPGLQPGAYTVRATVSYAEAPSGEKKSVTSEPVTVTVTAEHIKAAEAYWAALKAAQN